MASTKKCRTLSRRYAKLHRDYPDNIFNSANRSTMRKKNLSEMLGSQWSKEELEQFYDAYRKFGKEWKKVASVVPNRSVDMVAALYNMNKAYLSLPEGAASAAGLIAMMTDHYSNLEDGESERESNDGFGISHKFHKCGWGKLAPSKGMDRSMSDLLQCEATHGCMSLFKRKRSGEGRSRVVGKRTPRFPISYGKRDCGKIALSTRNDGRSEMDTDDDEVAHVVLALAGSSGQHILPDMSQSSKPAGILRSSVACYGRRKCSEFEAARAEMMGSSLDEGYNECSLGSGGAENEEFIRDREGVGAAEIARREKKLKTKRLRVPYLENNDSFEDVKEACSGTEEGLALRTSKDDGETEVTNDEVWHTSFSGPAWIGRDLSPDHALDALQTLADISVNILAPASTVESESSDLVKERNRKNHGAGGDNMKVSSLRDSSFDGSSISEAKKTALQSKEKNHKGRKKLLAVKGRFALGPQSEVDNVSHPKECVKMEASVDEENKFSSVGKHVPQFAMIHRQGKSAKSGEHSSSSDVGKSRTYSALPALQESSVVKFDRPIRQRSKRKMRVPKPSENAGNVQSERFSSLAKDRASDLKVRLSHCLSSKLLRRWCIYEWFYNAIDYPWFAKNEFVAYLDFAKLSKLPSKLTRKEWAVIRSALGKPRRLSDQLLHEERVKLEEYRENVRDTYAKLRAGIGEGLPRDLARPLSVGQRVIAWHPKTGELHDGSVLTVERSRCRIQFDWPDLGVELLQDTDCMPQNPLENMPEALKRQNIANMFYTPRVESHSRQWKMGPRFKLNAGDNPGKIERLQNVPSTNFVTLMQQAKGDTIDSVLQAKAVVDEAVAVQAACVPCCSTVQMKAREDDIKALIDVSRALDKKEAILKEIRNLHEEGSHNQKDENFRIQYAQVVTQLKNTDDQVSAALLALRERNTFNENSLALSSGKCPANLESSLAASSVDCSAFNNGSSYSVSQILDCSKRQARALVDVAAQAMASLKQGESPDVKVGQALDSIDSQLCGPDLTVVMTRSLAATSCSSHGAVFQEASYLSKNVENTYNSSEGEVRLPSELITSSVATLIMIQTCIERQCPPGEVAEILESALGSLEPCCPENVPIYAEIQTFMGVLKTQIVARIPTESSRLMAEISAG